MPFTSKLPKTTTVLPVDPMDATEILESITTSSPSEIVPGVPAAPVDSNTALAAAIVAAVNQNAGIPKVPYGLQKIRTPFNPRGIRERGLKKVIFQNNHRLNERMLHDEEIALLNQLKKGTYIDGKVQVIETRDGNEKRLHLRYKNKTVDQRQDLQAIVPTFRAMLNRIIDEQKNPPLTDD